MLAQQRREIADARPLFTAINCLLDRGNTVRREHMTREFTEFPAQHGFVVRLIKITPMALARMRTLAAVLECHGDTRWPQARSNSTHRRVFGHLYALT